MASVQVDLEIYNYLIAHGMGAGETASSILRRVLMHTIDLDDDLVAYISSLAVSPGESIASILRRELDIHGSDHDDAHPALIEFHIPAGTGSGAWNTPDHQVIGSVGQTLRIFNDDTVVHRPHTPGAPFPHAANDIAPNTFADFVLQQPYDPGANTQVYDHDYGTNAKFWITVRAAS